MQHLVKQETLCRPYAAATARRARARSFVAASCRTSRYPHDPDGAISAKTAEFSACLCGKPISPPRVGKCSEVTAAPHGRWSVSDETSKPLPIWRGTEGSNPSPSSRQSGLSPEFACHGREAALSTGLAGWSSRRGRQRRAERGNPRQRAIISLSGRIPVPQRRCGWSP